MELLLYGLFQVEEIENLKEYVADLAADVAADGVLPYMPFSGSFNFRQMADEALHKQTKTFLMRAYCFRYEAGLAAIDATRSAECPLLPRQLLK